MYQDLEKMLKEEKEKYEKQVKDIENSENSDYPECPQDNVDYWYGKLDAIAEIKDFIKLKKEMN